MTTETHQLHQLQSVWSSNLILCVLNHSLEKTVFSQAVTRLQGKEILAFQTEDHVCENRIFCLHLHYFS